MSPAELAAIEVAARAAAADAPPLTADQLAMLRRDGFPARRAAADRSAA